MARIGCITLVGNLDKGIAYISFRLVSVSFVSSTFFNPWNNVYNGVEVDI